MSQPHVAIFIFALKKRRCCDHYSPVAWLAKRKISRSNGTKKAFKKPVPPVAFLPNKKPAEAGLLDKSKTNDLIKRQGFR